MDLQQLRYQENKVHTKSLFLINGEFKCFLLEDGFNEVKVYGETRIPPGEYEVELRTEGGKHATYLKRYGPEFHKGMLWIRNIPNYKYVYIHTGNKPKDTLGCPLTGFSADSTKNEIGNSRNAYKLIYPIIRDAILSGECVTIEIS
jgi:hypothetical protein